MPAIKSVTLARKGCAGLALAAIAAVLVFFSWPFRAESVVDTVSANTTGCVVEANNYSGWQTKLIAPGIHAEDVGYPLQIYVFVSGCSDLAAGKPYSVELISPVSGKLLARGLECGNAPSSEYPCRLEAPPVLRSDPHRYIVRVARKAGEKPIDAELRLTLHHEWKIVVIEAMMSV